MILVTMKQISFETHLSTFLPLPQFDLSVLLKLFKPREMKKNEFYIKAGEQATTLSFLEKGIMRTFYNTTEGNEYNKVFFENPSIVVTMSMPGASPAISESQIARPMEEAFASIEGIKTIKATNLHITLL